ncbi:MAG: DUF1329 domain-containing protein [Gammaproteobacteria bacterium]|nr:DUF1329 domain-containing protein [Gammaproteobacteria bacterium]
MTPAGAIRAGNAEAPFRVEERAHSGAGGLQTRHFPSGSLRGRQTRVHHYCCELQAVCGQADAGPAEDVRDLPGLLHEIYPTRRSAVFRISHKAALKNGGRIGCHIDQVPGLVGFENARNAWAFPIPKNGPQALVNLMARPVIPWKSSWDNIAPVTSSGSYEVNKLSVQQNWPYSDPANSWDNPNYDPASPGGGLKYYQTTTAPAKQAGQVVLVRSGQLAS